MSEKRKNKNDIRISYHTGNSNNKEFMIVAFYNDLEELVGKYIRFYVVDNRLYFEGSEVKKKGFLTVNSQGRLMLVSQVPEIKKFEGVYPDLRYSPTYEQYFVDMLDALPITYLHGNFKVPKFNYKKHYGKKPEQEIVTENNKESPTENLIKALFDFQVYVEGMDSAVKLLNSLNDKYK